MAEQKTGVSASTVTPPAAAAAATQQVEKVQPPLEISARNGAVKIVKDGNEVNIDFDPMIVQELGAYQRCKVRLKFTEGGGVTVMPYVQQ